MRHPLFPRRVRGVPVVALAIAGLLAAPIAGALVPEAPLLDWQRGWKSFDGMYVKYDPAGVFSCYSLNGRNCSSESPAAPGAAYPIPFECRSEEQGGDWCERAHAATFARWFNYEALGYPGRLSKSLQGHTMCESYDGRNCARRVEGDRISDPARIRPLICGPRHQAQWGGVSGYDRTGHWCSTPEIVQRHVDVALEAGRSVALRVPDWIVSSHPGWIVRAEVPRGGQLTVQTKARASPTFHFSSDRDVDMTAGYVAGAHSRPFLQFADGDDVDPPTRFTPPRPDGALTVALRVGRLGGLCFQHTAGFNGAILGSAAVGNSLDMLRRSPRPVFSVVHGIASPAEMAGASLVLHATTAATVRELIAIQSRVVPRESGNPDRTGLSDQLNCPDFY